RERFVEFGLELFALASRLCGTHAEKYLADQLLRCGLSVSAHLSESRAAESEADYRALVQAALKDLRQTGYWLMLAHKAGLLEKLSKSDLEKTCQSLTTLLTDFARYNKTSA